jgi:hypothetical protein
MKCPNCGGEHIESGIAWGKSTESGNVGLKYQIKIIFGVTQVYSDLCLDCGEIVRSYIKDTTDKKWVKKPGTFGSK